jgi:hypothetical protein
MYRDDSDWLCPWCGGRCRCRWRDWRRRRGCLNTTATARILPSAAASTPGLLDLDSCSRRHQSAALSVLTRLRRLTDETLGGPSLSLRQRQRLPRRQTERTYTYIAVPPTSTHFQWAQHFKPPTLRGRDYGASRARDRRAASAGGMHNLTRPLRNEFLLNSWRHFHTRCGKHRRHGAVGCVEAEATAFLRLGPDRRRADMAAGVRRDVTAQYLKNFKTPRGVRVWLAHGANQWASLPRALPLRRS